MLTNMERAELRSDTAIDSLKLQWHTGIPTFTSRKAWNKRIFVPIISWTGASRALRRKSKKDTYIYKMNQNEFLKGQNLLNKFLD